MIVLSGGVCIGRNNSEYVKFFENSEGRIVADKEEIKGSLLPCTHLVLRFCRAAVKPEISMKIKVH